jgi:hypothetical protein
MFLVFSLVAAIKNTKDTIAFGVFLISVKMALTLETDSFSIPGEFRSCKPKLF